MNTSTTLRLATAALLALAAACDATTDPAPTPTDTTTAATNPGDAPCPHHAAPPEPTPLPGTSVFHLEHPFTDTTGRTLRLSELRGQPTVMVMFYGGCTTACPILFADGQRLDAMLDTHTRSQTRFVYVTIDPQRDTPEALRLYAQRRNLDMNRWMLLSAAEPHTRALAATLGVQYRADGKGDFSHTSRLAILDKDGSVVGTVDGLNQPLEAAAALLTRLATPDTTTPTINN